MIRDILTPGSDGSPAYRRAVIGMAHALLGAAIAAPLAAWLGSWSIAAAIGLALAYWVAKEWGDLRRGGTWWDGIEDTLMVFCGTLYDGPWQWPVAALVAGGVLMLSGATRA